MATGQRRGPVEVGIQRQSPRSPPEMPEPVGVSHRGTSAASGPGQRQQIPQPQPPRETREFWSSYPLLSGLLPPKCTLKGLLRASVPLGIKGFSRASARRLQSLSPLFLIPLIERVAAGACRAVRLSPAEPNLPRRHGSGARTKARRAPKPRPALGPCALEPLAKFHADIQQQGE